MPRGDKSAYTDKQKRKAEHIAAGYVEQGRSEDEAEAIAWATVNRESGGGNLSGSGRGQPDSKVSAKRGGAIGGKASAGARRSSVRPRRRGPPRRGRKKRHDDGLPELPGRSAANLRQHISGSDDEMVGSSPTMTEVLTRRY